MSGSYVVPAGASASVCDAAMDNIISGTAFLVAHEDAARREVPAVDEATENL